MSEKEYICASCGYNSLNEQAHFLHMLHHEVVQINENLTQIREAIMERKA